MKDEYFRKLAVAAFASSMMFVGAYAQEGATTENISISGDAEQVLNGENITLGTLTITQGTEGQTAKLSITGDTTLTVPTGASTNSSVGASKDATNVGSAILEVTGSNNKLDFQGGAIWLGPNSLDSFYGDTQVLISGSNNTFTTGSIVIGRGNSGGSVLLSITGSNNVFQHTGAFRTYLYMGRSGVETAGTNKVYLRGDGASSESRVYFYSADPLKFNGSAANEALNLFVVDGNATFQWKDKTSGALGSMDVYMNAQGAELTSAYGKARFEVNGSGNDVDINTLALGNNAQVAGSTSTFSVSGSGSTIDVNALRVVGGAEVGHSGGALEFKFTEGDISTVNVASVEEFSGMLVLDFSALSAGEYNFDLISSTGGWFAIWEDFAWDNDSQSSSSGRISILGADGEVLLTYDSGVLSASYTAVPEPATWALLLGALALGFAYFKRKSK